MTSVYDKLSAMAHLAKLLNLLVDRQETSGASGGSVGVTDHRADHRAFKQHRQATGSR